jgi:leader peptidase (prepilin peptidase)/N-methyltransferase
MSTAAIKPTAAQRLHSLPVLAGTAAVTLLVAALAPTAATATLRALLVLIVVPCALIDIERRIIPNRITGPAAVLAILVGLALDASGEPRRLLWAGVAGGFLLIAALISPGGMGMGDVKLLAVLGLLLGPPVVIALLIALLGNVAAAAVVARRRGIRAARKTTMPFGPFLAVGGALAAVAGSPILHAYLSMHH